MRSAERWAQGGVGATALRIHYSTGTAQQRFAVGNHAASCCIASTIRQYARGGQLNFTLQVHHGDNPRPSETVQCERSGEVLELLQELLARHPECSLIHVFLGTT